MTRAHSHYFKDVAHLREIDVYRVIELFNVTNPCIQHAIKKLLVPGGRGAGKEYERDLREAADSINRALQMIAEDANKGVLEPQRRKFLEGEWIDGSLIAQGVVHGSDGLPVGLMPDNPALTGTVVNTLVRAQEAGERAAAHGVDTVSVKLGEVHQRSMMVNGSEGALSNG